MPLQNPQSADHLAAAAGEFEPQRLNNFSIEIPLSGSDRDLIIASLDGFTMPVTSNEAVDIPYQNEKRKVAGPASVENATLKLKDFVDKDTMYAILRWRKQVYDKVTGKIGLARDYKKTCNIILHAPDGTNQRVAKAMGVWPSADPGGDLDMTSTDSRKLDVPLQVDKIIWAGSL